MMTCDVRPGQSCRMKNHPEKALSLRILLEYYSEKLAGARFSKIRLNYMNGTY